MFSKDSLKYHGISLLNTSFIVVFTILPFIFGILFKMLFSKLDTLTSFYARGEFFLYTVSLISSAYISYYSVSSSKKLFEGWLRNLSFLLLVIVSGCYALILSSTLTPRTNMVGIISIISFLLSVLLFYASQYMITKRSPDIINLRSDEQKSIQNKLN
jgi:hypothetical protein